MSLPSFILGHASKAKGMWMGGTPPLGYQGDGHSLAIVDEHAPIVRDIYARHLKLGNVRLLTEQLCGQGVRTYGAAPVARS